MWVEKYYFQLITMPNESAKDIFRTSRKRFLKRSLNENIFRSSLSHSNSSVLHSIVHYFSFWSSFQIFQTILARVVLWAEKCFQTQQPYSNSTFQVIVLTLVWNSKKETKSLVACPLTSEQAHATERCSDMRSSSCLCATCGDRAQKRTKTWKTK